MTRPTPTPTPTATVLEALKALSIDGAYVHITIADLVERTGLSAATVRRYVRKLEADGIVEVTVRRRYDAQGGRAANLFGGAGAVVRRYLEVQLRRWYDEVLAVVDRNGSPMPVSRRIGDSDATFRYEPTTFAATEATRVYYELRARGYEATLANLTLTVERPDHS